MNDVTLSEVAKHIYWNHYGRCPMCGQSKGEPCRIIRDGKRTRVRAEAHFYRERI